MIDFFLIEDNITNVIINLKSLKGAISLKKNPSRIVKKTVLLLGKNGDILQLHIRYHNVMTLHFMFWHIIYSVIQSPMSG